MPLNLLVIKTANPDSLVEFYNALGLKFTYHQHRNGPFHYASEMNKMVFEIYPLPANQQFTDKTTRLGFSVENLDETVLKLQKLGVTVQNFPKQTQWGYRVVVEDFDGRKVELVEEEKESNAIID